MLQNIAQKLGNSSTQLIFRYLLCVKCKLPVTIGDLPGSEGCLASVTPAVNNSRSGTKIQAIPVAYLGQIAAGHMAAAAAIRRPAPGHASTPGARRHRG